MAAGSKLYQLNALKTFLNNLNLKNSFTNQVLLQTLGNYLNFVNKSLLDIPESHSLLEYFYEIQDLMVEVDFMHKFFFANNSFSSNLASTFILGTDTENLDVLYTVSTTLNNCRQTQYIIRTLMQDSISHMSKLIHGMLFKEPSVNSLISSLKFTYKRNELGEFEFQNAPKMLANTLQPLFLSVQVLSLLRIYEPTLYRILTSWQCAVVTSCSAEDLAVSIERCMDSHGKAWKQVSSYLASIYIGRDNDRLALMQKRLTRLRQMKFRIEEQRDEQARLKEIEIFKRHQLQHFLEEQISAKRVKNLYEKQLQIEMERDAYLDQVLKQKEAEKQQLLKEIEGIGQGVDDEIEKALIEQTLEKINLRNEEEDIHVNEFESEAANNEISTLNKTNMPSAINVNESIILTHKESSAEGGSTYDFATLQTRQNQENSAHNTIQEITLDPESVKLTVRDSFAGLADASYNPQLDDSMMFENLDQTDKVSTPTKKSIAIDNELDNSKHENKTPVSISKRNSVLMLPSEGRYSPSKTDKKLRQVRDVDLNIDLKDVSKLVFSNLINISKVQLENKNEKNDDGLK